MCDNRMVAQEHLLNFRALDISRNKAVAAAPAQIRNFLCPTMSLLRSDFAQILPDLLLSQIISACDQHDQHRWMDDNFSTTFF